MIEQLDIPLPLISEQKRIVEKLDALITLIDTAIEHLQESVKLADALYASQLSNVFSLGHEQWLQSLSVPARIDNIMQQSTIICDGRQSNTQDLCFPVWFFV